MYSRVGPPFEGFWVGSLSSVGGADQATTPSGKAQGGG